MKIRKCLWKSFVLSLFAISLHVAESTEVNFESHDINRPPVSLTLVPEWRDLEELLKRAVKFMDLKIFSMLPQYFESINLSSQCQKNIKQFTSGLKDLETWALRLIDASGKTIDGVLYGTYSSYGSYDECVDTVATDTQNDVIFRGQYCIIDTEFPLPPRPRHQEFRLPPELTALSEKLYNRPALVFLNYLYATKLRLGICVPSGCEQEDVDKVVKALGKLVFMNTRASRCEIKEVHKLSPFSTFVILWYFMIALLVFIASLIDAYSYYTKVVIQGTYVQVLLSFSLVSNFRKFSNTNSGELSCLHGVRFLTMTWVMLGHTYEPRNFHVHHNAFQKCECLGNLAFQVIVNAFLGVETFFFLSGLLVCYCAIKSMKTTGHSFSIKVHTIRRIWRLLPLYLHVLMLTPFLNGGNGPVFYETTQKYLKTCSDTWWKNVFFVNNLFNTGIPCLPYTWYIAADFQLHLCASVILLLLLRSPKAGILACFLGIMGSIFYSGIATYVNEYPPTVLLAFMSENEVYDWFNQFYFKPFPHATPYFIGMLVGYLLSTKPDLKISPKIQVLGWSTAFIVSSSVVHGTVRWNRGVEPTVLQSVLYASLSRTLWALGIAWMIVCCVTEHGGVINYILSWKMFVPLGRLSYAEYLIQAFVLLYTEGQIATLVSSKPIFTLWVFLGNLCVSCAAAFVFSMLFEVPFFSLENVLLQRHRSNRKQTTSSEHVSHKLSVHTD